MFYVYIVCMVPVCMFYVYGVCVWCVFYVCVHGMCVYSVYMCCVCGMCVCGACGVRLLHVPIRTFHFVKQVLLFLYLNTDISTDKSSLIFNIHNMFSNISPTQVQSLLATITGFLEIIGFTKPSWGHAHTRIFLPWYKCKPCPILHGGCTALELGGYY